MNQFKYISETATEPHKAWTNKQIAQFHFFNPNGLLAQKKQTDEQIDKLVDSGKASTGAFIAYGSLNKFYWEKLCTLIGQKRVNGADLSATLKGLRHAIEKAKEFIEEKTPKSESSIELFAEREMNRLDKKLMQGHISQYDYDARVTILNNVVERELKSI